MWSWQHQTDLVQASVLDVVRSYRFLSFDLHTDVHTNGSRYSRFVCTLVWKEAKSSVALVPAGHVSQAHISWRSADPHLHIGIWHQSKHPYFYDTLTISALHLLVLFRLPWGVIGAFPALPVCKKLCAYRQSSLAIVVLREMKLIYHFASKGHWQMGSKLKLADLRFCLTCEQH